MLHTGDSPVRLGRVLIASLALVANLIAAGVPVLHAWAHEVAHHHEAASTEASEVDHPHDQVHPPALHDECILAHRAPLHLGFAIPAAPLALESIESEEIATIHPVRPVASRAPPGQVHARAPPLA